MNALESSDLTPFVPFRVNPFRVNPSPCLRRGGTGERSFNTDYFDIFEDIYEFLIYPLLSLYGDGRL
jgi:hypothetical protein